MGQREKGSGIETGARFISSGLIWEYEMRVFSGWANHRSRASGVRRKIQGLELTAPNEREMSSPTDEIPRDQGYDSVEKLR